MISLWPFFWLVGGEVSGSLCHQPSGSKQSSVCVLVGSIPSLTVNFSHMVGVSVSAKQLKDTLCVSLEGEPGPCPKAALLFLLIAPPLSLHPLPSLINSYLFEPAPWNSGKVMEVERSLFTIIKKWGHRKGFCSQESHRVLLIIKRTAAPVPTPSLSFPGIPDGATLLSRCLHFGDHAWHQGSSISLLGVYCEHLPLCTWWIERGKDLRNQAGGHSGSDLHMDLHTDLHSHPINLRRTMRDLDPLVLATE